MCVNANMIPAETVPGIRGGGTGESSGGGISSMIYLMHCKNLCKRDNVPHPAQQFLKKQMEKSWKLSL
jgi:hypothetical protein